MNIAKAHYIPFKTKIPKLFPNLTIVIFVIIYVLPGTGLH